MLLDYQNKPESPLGFHSIGEPFSGETRDAPLGERGPFGVQPRLASPFLVCHRLAASAALNLHVLLRRPTYRRAQARQGRSLPSLRSLQLRAPGWPRASL
jgi:hypothetical protein